MYTDMATCVDRYDTSNYPKHHPLENKKVVGKVKDEYVTMILIVDYVGLHQNMYSICSSDDKEIQRAEGVKKYAVHKCHSTRNSRALTSRKGLTSMEFM